MLFIYEKEWISILNLHIVPVVTYRMHLCIQNKLESYKILHYSYL